MKKILIVVGMVMVMSFLVVACSTAIDDQETPAATGEKTDMMKEDDQGMEEAEMVDKEAMDSDMDSEGGHSDDTMDKEDGMDDKDAMDKEDGMDDKDAMDKDGAMMKNDGDMAPEFSLMGLEGETVTLSELQGQKVYLKFWASWCPICVGGLEELDELAGGQEDFTVVTIVSPEKSGEKSIEDFKEWYATKATENITVLFDVDGDIQKDYGIRGFPTSAYIGSDGVLIKVAPGHQGNELIRESFESIY